MLVKIDGNGSIFKIYDSGDLENLLQVVNIDELINNLSSLSHTILKHGISSCEFYNTSTLMSALCRLIWWIYFVLALAFLNVYMYLFNFCYSLHIWKISRYHIWKLSRYFTSTNILIGFKFWKVLSVNFLSTKQMERSRFDKQSYYISVIHTKCRKTHGKSH